MTMSRVPIQTLHTDTDLLADHFFMHFILSHFESHPLHAHCEPKSLPKVLLQDEHSLWVLSSFNQTHQEIPVNQLWAQKTAQFNFTVVQRKIRLILPDSYTPGRT